MTEACVELLVLTNRTELEVFCPGCAEFLLYFGVKPRDSLMGFEAYCPRCDVAVLSHTAVVCDHDTAEEREDFRPEVLELWRGLIEDEPSLYLDEFQYRAAAFGWDVELSHPEEGTK